jgi:alkanesulfonate monooxygenase SsuD/methylene tetrahydromethanopterin reductase-like flavin-dependent oxidoreductase (luciferase family)
MLEDALELLPLMWGPGAPRFEGRTITVAEALCYPRPIQGRIPLLVGGGGERRTLRLAARYANACNWFGDAATVTHKREVLQRHCADVGRDVGDIEITHLSTVLAAPDPASLRDTVEPLRSARESADQFSRRVNAATVEDHIGRFRQLADAGVQTAIVNLPNVEDPSALHHFAAVIDAFRSTP